MSSFLHGFIVKYTGSMHEVDFLLFGVTVQTYQINQVNTPRQYDQMCFSHKTTNITHEQRKCPSILIEALTEEQSLSSSPRWGLSRDILVSQLVPMPTTSFSVESWTNLSGNVGPVAIVTLELTWCCLLWYDCCL